MKAAHEGSMSDENVKRATAGQIFYEVVTQQALPSCAISKAPYNAHALRNWKIKKMVNREEQIKFTTIEKSK